MLLTNNLLLFFMTLSFSVCLGNVNQKLTQVFEWKQLTYDFDGIKYTNDSIDKRPNATNFEDGKYFVQYNNVPVGFEVYENKVFITVPRRRPGIPSTLNYVPLSSESSPDLKPYLDEEDGEVLLVSLYRPRVDACGRLWVVDTGLLEFPGDTEQLQEPAIIIYDLKNNKRILKYELKSTDLVNENTSGGLTSIVVDVTPDACDDAFAYINDLATEGLVVFSLKQLDSWRIQHDTFKHDLESLNFTVAGLVVPWKDGLFGMALSDPDAAGKRTLYYHPLVSTQEYAVDTDVLKNKKPFQPTLLGTKGPNTQSGSSGYHAGTRTIFYANVAQDAILCWNVDNKMAPENVAIAAQDHNLLVYIADLKVIGDEVWMLVNQMPRFVYSTLSITENNFFIHKAKVQDLIRGTVCDKSS